MNSTQDSTATQKSLFTRYQEHITSAIFIGLVLGILTGLFLASRFDVVLTVTTLLGSIYMNALNMMIFPLVFCSIVVGITSIGNAKNHRKNHRRCHDILPAHYSAGKLCGADYPQSYQSWKRQFGLKWQPPISRPAK